VRFRINKRVGKRANVTAARGKENPRRGRLSRAKREETPLYDERDWGSKDPPPTKLTNEAFKANSTPPARGAREILQTIHTKSVIATSESPSRSPAASRARYMP